MRKTTTNHQSHWKKLTPEQKTTLEDWLFKQNLTYPQVIERAEREFGIIGSRSSVARYFKTLAREQIRRDFSAAQSLAEAAGDEEIHLPSLRDGAMKMIAKRLIHCVSQPAATADLEELSVLTRLLLAAEQQQIQREWVSLARDRFCNDNGLPMPDEPPKELSPEEEELERLEERFSIKCRWNALRSREAAAEAYYGPEPESPEEPENQPT